MIIFKIGAAKLCEPTSEGAAISFSAFVRQPGRPSVRSTIIVPAQTSAAQTTLETLNEARLMDVAHSGDIGWGGINSLVIRPEALVVRG